jgi:ketosteroid isomerase-like protein
MEQEITKQIEIYETCLNTSDTHLTMKLYGREPIFMAEFSQAFIGRDAVQRAYTQVFHMIKLSVKFTIHEIVNMGGDLAYVRTTSAGQQKMLATGKISPEANNELFVFRKEDGQWKIHRYLFASSKLPEAN